MVGSSEKIEKQRRTRSCHSDEEMMGGELRGVDAGKTRHCNPSNGGKCALPMSTVVLDAVLLVLRSPCVPRLRDLRFDRYIQTVISSQKSVMSLRESSFHNASSLSDPECKSIESNECQMVEKRAYLFEGRRAGIWR